MEEGNEKPVKFQTIVCGCQDFFSGVSQADQKITVNCKEKNGDDTGKWAKFQKILSHFQKKGKNEPTGRSYPHRGG